MNLEITQKNPSLALLKTNKASLPKRDVAFGMKITLLKDVYSATKKEMHEVATEIDPTDNYKIYPKVVQELSRLASQAFESIAKYNNIKSNLEGSEIFIDKITPIYQKDKAALKIATHSAEYDSFGNVTCTPDNADNIADLIQRKIGDFRWNTQFSDGAFLKISSK